MDQHTAAASTHHARTFSASLREALNFESIFRIPASHRLLVVRSRTRGGLFSAVYWEHEEYDAAGRLICRYKSFDEVSPAGLRQVAGTNTTVPAASLMKRFSKIVRRAQGDGRTPPRWLAMVRMHMTSRANSEPARDLSSTTCARARSPDGVSGEWH